MAEALGMVKVGNMACGFWKLTPRSRTAAMAGAVSGVTICARSPSGTNRMRLCGGSASAEPAKPLARIAATRMFRMVRPSSNEAHKLAPGQEGFMTALEREGEAEAGIAVLALLAVELLGAAEQAQIEADLVLPEHLDAGGQVADQRLLVDAAAVGEAVAVEEDILRHRPALAAGEEIIAEAGAAPVRIDPIRARRARPDARRPVIGFEIVADADDAADGAVGEHVAGGDIGLGHEIDADAAELDDAESPMLVVRDSDARLVLELVVPA